MGRFWTCSSNRNALFNLRSPLPLFTGNSPSVFPTKNFSDQLSQCKKLASEQYLDKAQGHSVRAVEREGPNIDESGLLDKEENEEGGCGVLVEGENGRGGEWVCNERNE